MPLYSYLGKMEQCFRSWQKRCRQSVVGMISSASLEVGAHPQVWRRWKWPATQTVAQALKHQVGEGTQLWCSCSQEYNLVMWVSPPMLTNVFTNIDCGEDVQCIFTRVFATWREQWWMSEVSLLVFNDSCALSSCKNNRWRLVVTTEALRDSSCTVAVDKRLPSAERLALLLMAFAKVHNVNWALMCLLTLVCIFRHQDGQSSHTTSMDRLSQGILYHLIVTGMVQGALPQHGA